MYSEVASIGIQAYQSRDYDTAIAVLEEADSEDWTGQLYLAMSYYMIGRCDDSQRVFFRLKTECPDKEIRQKAESAFAAVRAKLRQEAEDERKRLEEESLRDPFDFR